MATFASLPVPPPLWAIGILLGFLLYFSAALVVCALLGTNNRGDDQ